MADAPVDAAIARFVRHDAALLFVALDAAGVIRDANRHALRLAGEDLPGKPFSSLLVDFTHPLDPALLAEKGAKGILATMNSQAGLPRTYTLSFVQDEGFILVFGEFLAEEMDTLREQYIRLTGELNNLTRQTQKTNAELVKLNEVKNRFLGIAAHDLRNPIGAIKSYSEFLLEENASLSPDQAEFLQTINESSSYMLGLLDDLLDIARIESGRLGLELRETDLPALARRCASLNRPLADRKGVSITLACHGQLPPILADSLKIEQVMNNLLSNAVKFSSPGQTIEVDLFLCGGFVTVAVKDQGKGIASQNIGRIFDPFNRISSRGTAGERCSGLGLSIARKIVQGHEGRIWVESEEGKGATFYFTLPVNPGSQEASCSRRLSRTD